MTPDIKAIKAAAEAAESRNWTHGANPATVIALCDEVERLTAALSEPAPVQEPVAKPVKVWCETCEGTGKVHQEHQAGCWVGGEYTCPDCDGDGFVEINYTSPKAQQPAPPADVPMLTDAVRYKKLRRWMSSNVKEGWEEVERMGAVASWVGWDDFDAYLDALPECAVGLVSPPVSTEAASQKAGLP